MKKLAGVKKGSITIEAAITLPIFICFFALLTFSIKAVYINMHLNHAVNETAKQLASASYPIALLNELEDEVFSEGMEGGIPSFSDEKEKIKDYLKSSSSDILQKLLTGNLDTDDIIEIFNGIKSTVISDYSSGIAKYLVNSLGDDYYEIKARAKYKAADMILDMLLKKDLVDKGKIDILFVELPQSDTEYRYRVENEEDKAYNRFCSEIGFIPSRDDVVICIQYRTVVPIPLIKNKEITYRYTATEKAWVNGSNGIYTVEGKYEQESDNEQQQTNGNEINVEESYKNLQKETVYVTKVGKRYHKDGCRYLTKSKIPLKIDIAEKKAYTPCKKCYGK